MGNRLLKPIETWLKLSLFPPIGAAVIRALGRSMRIEVRGHEQVDALYRNNQNIILAFWHAQQLMIPFGYRGPGSHVLISQHRDGEIIARIISTFGHRAVRGSSTRGGAGALRELIRLGRSGRDVVVTPDGPKGPAQVAKMGVIQLARASGLPIVPLAFSCSKKNTSRAGIVSWSRTPGRTVSFSGGRRSGSHEMRMQISWKPRGWNWKPR
ncbi:MAG TPA: lysophospholipid acyltransferase family protein [Nitrospira sp.]|nr:lysophospholipid acyltransferase family protein [Nitrospira sp.]